MIHPNPPSCSPLQSCSRENLDRKRLSSPTEAPIRPQVKVRLLENNNEYHYLSLFLQAKNEGRGSMTGRKMLMAKDKETYSGFKTSSCPELPRSIAEKIERILEISLSIDHLGGGFKNIHY